MKRGFLTDKENDYLKRQESTEEKTSKKQKDYTEYLDYSYEYSDLFIEEVEKQEKERINKWKNKLIEDKKNLTPEQWINVKNEVLFMINEGILEHDILYILKDIDKNP